MTNDKEQKVGTFLVENGIVSEKQLQEALELQKDNKERLVGQILVTQGVLTKEDMIMALEMYLMVTDTNVDFVDEWLDQEEVDMIMDRMKNKK